MNLILKKKIKKEQTMKILYFKIGKISEILEELHRLNQNEKR